MQLYQDKLNMELARKQSHHMILVCEIVFFFRQLEDCERVQRTAWFLGRVEFICTILTTNNNNNARKCTKDTSSSTKHKWV